MLKPSGDRQSSNYTQQCILNMDNVIISIALLSPCCSCHIQNVHSSEILNLQKKAFQKTYFHHDGYILMGSDMLWQGLFFSKKQQSWRVMGLMSKAQEVIPTAMRSMEMTTVRL